MLESIQALRAVAALAVAAFHLSGMMGEARYGGDAVFADATRLGYLGVDLFFVLSGFIIVHAHARDIGRPEALRDYAWRRIVRIYPVYWLYTGVFVTLVAFGIGAAAQLPYRPVDYLTSFSLVRFSGTATPLPVAWTLFHELAFYAVFALLIASRRWGLAALAAAAAVCLWDPHLLPHDDLGPREVYTAVYNLFFVIGMLAWLACRRPSAVRLAIAIVLSLLCFSAGFTMAEDSPLARVMIATAFASLVTALVCVERLHGLRVPRAAVAVGNASYSLYLLHEPLSGLALKVLRRVGVESALGREAVYAAATLSTVLLSCAAFRWIERPLLAVLREPPWRTRRTAQNGRARVTP